MPSRLAAAVLAAVLALAACAGDDGDDDRAAPEESPLVPTFPPEGEDDAPADGDHDDDRDDEPAPADPDEPVAPETADDDGQQAEEPAPADPEEPAAPEPADDDGQQAEEPAPDDDPAAADRDDPPSDALAGPTASSVTDPRGDTTSPLLGSAPDWADLVAGSVERTGTGDVTITIELAEPPEPPRSGTTMNVASFHDLTGDGRIDLEVWANWSQDGWFPSWRDNREGRAAFGDDAGIGLDHDGATLEAVVPADRFGDAVAWRWSLGLEWGRYEWLGTSNAAHDLAPDEGFVVHGD